MSLLIECTPKYMRSSDSSEGKLECLAWISALLCVNYSLLNEPIIMVAKRHDCYSSQAKVSYFVEALRLCYAPCSMLLNDMCTALAVFIPHIETSEYR